MSCNSLAVHIDYIQGLCNFDSFESLTDFIAFLNTSGDIWTIDNSSTFWSGRSFNNRLSSTWGGSGGYNFLSFGYELLLVLPGQFCSACSESWIISLIQELRRINFICTRLDIAVDDFSRSVGLGSVVEAAKSGSLLGFESYRIIDGNGVNTVYFGAPTSDKQLRFYDADFIHGIAADRWELQLRREYAMSVLTSLDLSNLAFDLGSFFFSLVRFVDRVNGGHLLWWSNLVDSFDTISFSLPKTFSGLGRLEAWFTRQVLPSLCVFRFGLGKEGFIDYLETRCHDALFSDRLSSKHYALIDFLNSNSEVLNG